MPSNSAEVSLVERRFTRGTGIGLCRVVVLATFVAALAGVAGIAGVAGLGSQHAALHATGNPEIDTGPPGTGDRPVEIVEQGEGCCWRGSKTTHRYSFFRRQRLSADGYC